MEIDLILCRDHVEVFFRNTLTTELRLWELHNSWGTWSVSLQLRDEQDSCVYTIKRSDHIEFTINGPTYVVLAPGERRAFPIHLNDGFWERDEVVAHLKDIPLSVRVSYQVKPSPEANELGVFVGSALSDWVTALPPHDWLFTQAPNWEELAKRLKGVSPDEVLYIFCNEIETQTRLIEEQALLIHEDPSATSMVLGKMSSEMTVGHVVNSILEIAAAIRQAVWEKRIYIGAKPHLGTGDVTTGAQSDK